MESPRIKPIRPCNILISSYYSYRDYFRKGVTSAKKVKFLYLKKPYSTPLNHDKQMQFRLLKTLKNIKFARAVDISGCNMRNESIQIKWASSISKRMCTLDTLYIKDYWQSINGFFPKVRFWTKNIKTLKKLHYKMTVEYVDKYAETKDFKKEIKLFYDSLKPCKQMKELIINLPGSNELLISSFLVMPSIPPTLKSLTFRAGSRHSHYWITPNARNTALEKLKKLEILNLSLGSEADLIYAFVSKILATPKLKSLNLLLPLGMCNNASMPKGNELTFKNLKVLKLRLKPDEQDFYYIPDIFKVQTITHLSLTIEMFEEDQMQCLINYLSRIQDLQILKLKLKYRRFRNYDYIAKLFQQISRLRSLRSLKLYFLTSSDIMPEDYLNSMVPDLKTILNKEIPLEVFLLDCNQVDGTESFFKLMAEISNRAESYKKITLSLADYEPKRLEMIQLAKTIKKLANIRVLRFQNLKMSFESLPKELIAEVSHLKYLRKFMLDGKSYTLTKQSFIKVMEARRLSKNNALSLDLNNTTWKFN